MEYGEGAGDTNGKKKKWTIESENQTTNASMVTNGIYNSDGTNSNDSLLFFFWVGWCEQFDFFFFAIQFEYEQQELCCR